MALPADMNRPATGAAPAGLPVPIDHARTHRIGDPPLTERALS